MPAISDESTYRQLHAVHGNAGQSRGVFVAAERNTQRPRSCRRNTSMKTTVSTASRMNGFANP